MSNLIDVLAEWIVRDNAVFFIDSSLRYHPDEPSPTQQIVTALIAELSDYQQSDLSAVAQDFVVEKSDHRLVEVIQRVLDGLKGQPMPIYQGIAQLMQPQSKVITTHFDSMFEAALQELEKSPTVINVESEIPYFKDSQVTLIRIQGDIKDRGSLKITKDDIDNFGQSLPMMSELIRSLFVTKPLIFFGSHLDAYLFERFYKQSTERLRKVQTNGQSRFYRDRLHNRAKAILFSPLKEKQIRYWRNQYNLEVHYHEPFPFLQELSQSIKKLSRTNKHFQIIPKTSKENFSLSRPYKALKHFESSEVDIFAGRKEQSHKLKNRILVNPLTVLYGESGSGKTSLLHAGVGPLLVAEEIPFIVCRLTSETPLRDQIRRSLEEVEGVAPTGIGDTYAFIRTWQQTLTKNQPIMLGLDQFEQIFSIKASTEREAALQDLSRLVNDASLRLHLILVIRDDFLGKLEILDRYIPNLLNVRFRLARLDREAARAAIEQPADRFNITWEESLVQLLLDELTEGNNGRVAPPQLQIVCDQLYQRFAKSAVETARPHPVKITLEQFKQTGGAQAILSEYLEQTVSSFEAQRPKVQQLLETLVGSDQIRRRLSAKKLADRTELGVNETMKLLNQLAELRLLQRYDRESDDSLSKADRLEYELTHDYLAAEIVRWSEDEFGQRRRVGEILDNVAKDWEPQTGNLLSPDDLDVITKYRHQVGFSDKEKAIIYTAAVAYDHDPAVWQSALSAQVCRTVLLGLLQHDQALARRQAANHLVDFRDPEVITHLVHTSFADSEESVRKAAIQAVVRSARSGDQVVKEQVVSQLVEAVDTAHRQTARHALIVACDLEPTCQHFLPEKLSFDIRRRVWAVRRRRYWPDIQAKAIRGFQGGFLGLALAIVMLLGADEGSLTDSLFGWLFLIPLLILSMPITGIWGALAATMDAFLGTSLNTIFQLRPWYTWWIRVLSGAFLLGLGFVILNLLTSGSKPLIETFLAGFVMESGAAGMATLPWRISKTWRAISTVLVGMVVFGTVRASGLFFSQGSVTTMLLVGGVAGLCFYWGLQPEYGDDIANSTDRRE